MTTLPLTGWPLATEMVATTDLLRTTGDLSVAVTSAAVIFLMALIVAGVLTRERWPKYKGPLFTLIVLVTVTTTLVLAGSALARSFNSPTAGPVKWSADYQIWACGNQLELRDPRGLVNDRIGTPALYEKNDGTIRYQGTPQKLPDDASLGAFMQAIGGEVSDNSLIVPLNDGNGFVGTPQAPEQVEPYISTSRDGLSARFASDQTCGDDMAEIQTFVYNFNPATNTYSQTKIPHPALYELSHRTAAPPADCVIIEFAPRKDRTAHLCESYGVRDYDRCTEFGVPADKITRCDIREAD